MVILTRKIVNDSKLVYFPPATFQRYRLTFQKIDPSRLQKDNIRFVRLCTDQCNKDMNYQFFTKDENNLLFSGIQMSKSN